MNSNTLRKIITNSKNIYIASHMSPDGDNLGSLTAMYKLLLNLEKDVTLIIDDEIPDEQKFLPYLDNSVQSKELNKGADLFISLDCADISRLGAIQEIFSSSKTTVNIDHHFTNTNYADFNFVDKKSSATGELLYTLFKENNFDIDVDIATCLYVAISSDTGSFKYDSVTPYTLEVAANLLKYNINKSEININLYQNRSLKKTKVFLEALNSLNLYSNNKIAMVTISDALINNLEAKNSDADGIVEFIRDIAEVEIAILLKEKKDNVRLSVRTKSHANAINIASNFGGGGHIRAAGATIYLPIDDAKNKVLEYASMELK